jgi:hypothetical protein
MLAFGMTDIICEKFHNVSKVYCASNFKVNGAEDSSEGPVKLYHTTRPYIPEELLFHSENKGSTFPPRHR